MKDPRRALLRDLRQAQRQMPVAAGIRTDAARELLRTWQKVGLLQLAVRRRPSLDQAAVNESLVEMVRTLLTLQQPAYTVPAEVEQRLVAVMLRLYRAHRAVLSTVERDSELSATLERIVLRPAKRAPRDAQGLHH